MNRPNPSTTPSFRQKSAVLVALAPLLLAACSDDPAVERLPGQCTDDLAAVPPSATPIKVSSDGALVDGHGRQVTLRGLNSGGRSKWAPFVPFPIADNEPLSSFKTKADAYYARYKPWGLDTVRLTFSWEALEPTKGKYDEAYLDRYEAMVQAAGAHGLKVSVDFHQDVYASPFCGDGFPLWTLKDPNYGPPCRDNHSWFTNYFNTHVQDSFKRLFDNTDGLLDAFKAMWAKIAKRVGKHDNVIGYEIINEPGGWRADNLKVWKEGTLNPFHTAMVAHLKKPEVGGGKLVFFDNPGVEALAADTHHVRPKGDDLVYAPHYYDSQLLLGGQGGDADPAKALASFVTFSSNEGLHVLLGEFGYGATATGGETWLRKVMEFIDTNRWSSTLWEYSQNEELWNKEDLSVVDKDGKERPILDVYVRPWLRAVAGQGASFSWDGKTGKATAEWTAADGVSEIVAPSRLFPDGPKNVDVQNGCWTWDKARSELRVKASAGAAVKVAFSR